MSYYPPTDPYQPNPLQYHTPMQAYPSLRPQSVTVLAVLCIVFGSIGVLGGLCGIVPYVVNTGMPNPVVDAMRKDATVYAMTMLTMALSFGLATVQLVSGVGALSLKRWARQAMIFYAIAALVLVVVGAIQNFVWLFPLLDNVATSGRNAAAMQQAMMIAKVSGIGGMLLGPILPICVLIFMNKPHVKAAFAGMAPQAAGGWPGQQSPMGGYQPPYRPPGM